MYWFDGHLVENSTLEIDAADPALLYGATVFSTLRVWQSLDHPATAWSRHCDRISQSLVAFHWSQPDWGRLRRGAEQLAVAYPVLRLTVLPDGRELITGRPLPPDLSQRQRQGIVAWVAKDDLYRRSAPAHKTGNYLGSWLALQAARRQGAQEAILTDAEHWLETSTGSLWGWAAGRWWTPPLAAGILPGTMRSHLVHQLHQRGMAVEEGGWSCDLISRFEVLAYSNAVVRLLPIRTVIDRQIRLEYNVNHGALVQLMALSQPESGQPSINSE